MKFNVVAGDIAQQDVGAVVVNLFEGVTTPGGATGAVDKAMGGAISALIADGEIKGKSGEMTLIHTLGSITPKRVLIAGLGSAASFTLDGVRSVSAEAARYLNGIGVQSAATIVHGAGIAGLDEQASAQALAEGVVLGMYRFDKYKADASDANLKEITVVEFDESKLDALKSGINVGSIIGEGVNRCRDMANEPANSMTPSEMAEQALEVSQAHGVEIEVIERTQMKELGMGRFSPWHRPAKSHQSSSSCDITAIRRIRITISGCWAKASHSTAVGWTSRTPSVWRR